MYNKELKEKFLKSLTVSPKTIIQYSSYFEASEKYEEQHGGDLCTMSTKEIEDMLQDFCGNRIFSVAVRISVYRRYVKWCINEEHYPGACDSMFYAKTECIDQAKKRMVSDPAHLQRYLDMVFEPQESNTVDNTKRCYFWLAYCGVPQRSIMSISKEDIDFDGLLIRYKDGMYAPIYREALYSIKSCVELEYFVYKHPYYESKRPRVPGNIFFRGVRGDNDLESMMFATSKAVCKKKKLLVCELITIAFGCLVFFIECILSNRQNI